jgi:hypothetical protein
MISSAPEARSVAPGVFQRVVGQVVGRLALIGVQAEPVDRVFRWGLVIERTVHHHFLASSWASKTPRGITCANWPLSSSSSQIGGVCGCCRAAVDRY